MCERTCDQNHIDCVKCLEKYDLKEYAKEFYGDSCFETYWTFIMTHSYKCFEKMLENIGENSIDHILSIAIDDHYSCTNPTHKKVDEEEIEVSKKFIRIILEHGANPNAEFSFWSSHEEQEYQTIYDYAKKNGYENVFDEYSLTKSAV